MIYVVKKERINSNIVKYCDLEQVFYFIKNSKEVGVDIETTGLLPLEHKILTIQFGNWDDQYILEYTDELIPFLQTVLDIKTTTYVLQNSKFDLQFLLNLTHRIPEKVFDTMLVEKVLNMGIEFNRNSLEALSKKYLGLQLDKETRTRIRNGFESDRVIEYEAMDVKVLLPIKHIQEKLLLDNNLVRAAEIENKFVKALIYTELCGMYLNVTKWEEKCVKDDKALAEQEQLLNNWILDNARKYNFGDLAIAQPDLFNPTIRCNVLWSSPQQVIKLFKLIGINTTIVDEETEELKDSVEAGVLEYQAEKFPIIPIYLKYKELAKNTSTYGRNFYKHISDKTGRLHTKFNQLVDTGRLSSGGKDKNAGLEYINFQNIPATGDTRECFTAMLGNKLISADYSQQEQVVFANKCLDPQLLEFYDKNMGDMHSYIASKIFKDKILDTPLSEIPTKFKKERQKAKAAGFAINYGGDGKTIAENLNISLEEGIEVYKAYFEAFPGVANYFKRVQKETLRKGYILINDITGRKFYIDNFGDFQKLRDKLYKDDFWEKLSREREAESALYFQYYKPLSKKYSKTKRAIERKALNYPIQATSAEITKLATYFIFEDIYKQGMLFSVLICNLVHDEILLEAPKHLAEWTAKITTENMIRAGKILGCKRVPLKADAKIVDWWDH